MKKCWILLIGLVGNYNNNCNGFVTKVVKNNRVLLHSSSLRAENEKCDVLVIGSGPAGRSIAKLLSSNPTDESKIKVILADRNIDKKWVPNYGAWRKEWDAISDTYKNKCGVDGLEKAIDREWEVTDCYFGGSHGIPVTERFRLDKAYLRVDGEKLEDTLKGGYVEIAANHFSIATGLNVFSPKDSLTVDDQGCSIELKNDVTGDLIKIDAKLIIDCTGHESKLVTRDQRVPFRQPGYQIAYGALVELDENDTNSGPYDKEAMTLFDYRTDHLDDDDDDSAAESSPTFMYAMPLTDNKIFFEETSLVARPAISFQLCKDRCFKRLKHLGIKVSKVLEEEFCYIPMGGPLPAHNQRIIAFGGANAIVHPSTGYNLCRTLMAASHLSKVIKSELISKGLFNPDRAAANSYDAIWSPSNIRQRNFAVFGGEFLMKQNVQGLRGFFDGFFRLPTDIWAGFLAGWPGLPDNTHHETWFARLYFGLIFIIKLPPSVAFDLAFFILQYSLQDGVALPQSVTPFFGDPPSYQYEKCPKLNSDGDQAAKNEAKVMIQDSTMRPHYVEN